MQIWSLLKRFLQLCFYCFYYWSFVPLIVAGCISFAAAIAFFFKPLLCWSLLSRACQIICSMCRYGLGYCLHEHSIFSSPVVSVFFCSLMLSGRPLSSLRYLSSFVSCFALCFSGWLLFLLLVAEVLISNFVLYSVLCVLVFLFCWLFASLCLNPLLPKQSRKLNESFQVVYTYVSDGSHPLDILLMLLVNHMLLWLLVCCSLHSASISSLNFDVTSWFLF